MTARKPKSKPAAPRTAILIPCYNQENSIGHVVGAFRAVLPDAHLYVFDSGSTDSSSKVAREAGASVVFSPRRGKGHIMRHMFEVVEADAYVLVDGDEAYPASAVEHMLAEFWAEKADMVIGVRLEDDKTKSFRPLHKLGNLFLARLVSAFFSTRVHDVLSAYRILSRDFVKRVNLRAAGYEVETEMTVQCLARGFRLIEVPVSFGTESDGDRPRRYHAREGTAILKSLLWIFRATRPGYFFGVAAWVSLIGALVAVWSPTRSYLAGTEIETYRVIIATGLTVMAVFFFTTGVVLSHLNQQHLETQSSLRTILKDRGK
ncbi:MAG: glycosyltransferase [Candidatus Marinimicrobia bacterium]|nr:glycosyltransferase [Candidatus Neomarinimicrobiota bacterium]